MADTAEPILASLEGATPALVEFANLHGYRRIGLNAYADGRILVEGWWDAPTDKRGCGSGLGATVAEALAKLQYYRLTGHVPIHVQPELADA